MRDLARRPRDGVAGFVPRATSKVVARARTHRHQVVVLGGRLLRPGHHVPVRLSPDDVTVQTDGASGCRCSLHLLPPLVHGVHGEEAEDEEVHGGGDDGEAEEDEDDGEGDVLHLVGQHVVLLQGYEVAEADGGQGDEAVVEGVDVDPALWS